MIFVGEGLTAFAGRIWKNFENHWASLVCVKSISHQKTFADRIHSVSLVDTIYLIKILLSLPFLILCSPPLQ